MRDSRGGLAVLSWMESLMSLSFDANYYRSLRPDVWSAFAGNGNSLGLTWVQFAELHYNMFGRFEGSNPNAVFKTSEYLAANPDVAQAGVNPFQHYLQHGVHEGRSPSSDFPSFASFNVSLYLGANLDLPAAGITTATAAYAHFVLHGQFESRPGAPVVNTEPDVGHSGLPTALGTPFEQMALSPLLVNAISDPLFSSQWYLNNTGQRYGASDLKPATFLDMNIADAWANGYTGKGIVVSVNDDGMDLAHADLVGNLLLDLTYNSANGNTGPSAYATTTTADQGGEYAPAPDGNEHGTVVGSIIGMAANGLGMVGMAPEVQLVSTLVSDKVNWPRLFEYVAKTAKADVSVNSYGFDPAFSENFYVDASTDKTSNDYLFLSAIEASAREGRNGLGTVIEVSSGNKAFVGADASMTGMTNSKYIITVGAVNELGHPARLSDGEGGTVVYSTPGASVLVSAFGGENIGQRDQSVDAGFGIASADISGTLGYNKDAAIAEGDYSFQNTGTSYSGPMVGATVALMLQANPLLGFRDISNILAMTARVINPANHLELKGNLVNFGGLMFSREIGFGLVDVSAAVRLAASWTEPARTVTNWVSAEGASTTLAQDVPDGLLTGTLVTAIVEKNVLIERMEFDLKLDSAVPSQLRAEITSPQGTTITLFDQPLARSDEASSDTPWPGTFQIGATAFLGEQSAGIWTLKLIDKISGEVARFEALTVRAWGSELTPDSHYVLTDAFSGHVTVSDASGIDLFNAAAVSSSVTLDLNVGATSTVANGSFVIAAGVGVENAFGGGANDRMIGNEMANVLRGNGGADTITGGSGADLFMYATVNDSAPTNRDVLNDFTIGLDRIDLRLIDANLQQSDNQSFVFVGHRGDIVPHSVSYVFADADTLVRADVDGDQIADLEILLVGQKVLTASDFLGVSDTMIA